MSSSIYLLSHILILFPFILLTIILCWSFFFEKKGQCHLFYLYLMPWTDSHVCLSFSRRWSGEWEMVPVYRLSINNHQDRANHGRAALRTSSVCHSDHHCHLHPFWEGGTPSGNERWGILIFPPYKQIGSKDTDHYSPIRHLIFLELVVVYV